MSSVLVVGGVNVDTRARSTGTTTLRTSNPGRTTRSPGGVGRNVAENLGRLGTPVVMVGAVGRDPDGGLVRASLEDAGVAARLVETGHATGSYTAVLDEAGDLVVGVADMAATEALTPEVVDLLWPAEPPAWVVLDANLSPDLLRHCLRRARGIPVALDPVGVAKAARIPTLEGVHTITPNTDELVVLGDTSGFEVVWVRDGSAGSVVHHGGTSTRLELPPAEVVDVTGAGDAMLAAYVHRMVAGDDPVSAARFASAAGWLTVASPYAVRPDLDADLVRATLDRLRDGEPAR